MKDVLEKLAKNSQKAINEGVYEIRTKITKSDNKHN